MTIEQRQEVAELNQMLIVNEDRLGPKQYSELEVEVNKKIDSIQSNT